GVIRMGRRVENSALLAQRLADLTVDEELVLDPQRAGHAELGEPPGSDAQVGLKDPLELEQRLVVETHVVELRGGDASGPEAEGGRVRREGGVAFLAAE